MFAVGPLVAGRWVCLVGGRLRVWMSVCWLPGLLGLWGGLWWLRFGGVGLR